MKLLSLFVLLSFSISLKSQEEGIDIGIIADYHQLPNRSMESFGLQAYYHIDRFTLNYQLSVGPNLEGGIYVHATGGMAAAGFIFSRIDSTQRIIGGGMAVVGVICMLIPEGIGYEIKQSEKLNADIILNPLGYEYWKRKDPYLEEWSLSATAMFRLKYMIFPKQNVFLAPQAGVSYMYKTGLLGFKAGIMIGIHPEF